MNLAEIETFLTIVNTKSITRTADLLFLSQPTVSHRLTSLENELGFPLVIRQKGHKQVELTAKGTDFIIQRSARMIKSVPLAVSSTCLWPFFRMTRGKFSSVSREVRRWLTVGWDRNRRSAVFVILLVLTIARNVSISERFI